MNEKQLRDLIAEVKRGRVSRRRFIQTMVGLGLTGPLAVPYQPQSRGLS